MKIFNLYQLLVLHPRDVRKASLVAIITQRNKIVSVGFNRRKFEFTEDGRFTYHAEEAALRKAGSRAKNSTMYVFRIKKNGMLGMAKPCSYCQVLIKRHKVRKVIYSITPGL